MQRDTRCNGRCNVHCSQVVQERTGAGMGVAQTLPIEVAKVVQKLHKREQEQQFCNGIANKHAVQRDTSGIFYFHCTYC